MIIRSQNKKVIVNLDNVRGVYFQEVEKQEEIVFKVVVENYKLGYYSTEEKAIKVLDMIQNVYTQYGTLADGLGNIHGAFNIPKCFQMPQDSEV